ncbi:MAG: hypothetical protein IKW51_10170 [Bacteroidales bacterium]|nr:hypothetical protein [Bacteroidales bacterium]
MTNNIQNTQLDFIEKKFNISSLFAGILLIGIGAFMFFYSKNIANNMLSSTLIFFGIIAIAVALYILIAKLNGEVYAKTNSPIVRRQIYFDTADFYNIKSAVENGKYDSLDKFKRVEEGNVQIFVIHSKDRKFAALQVLKYEPFDFIPQTDIKIFEA